MSDFTETVQAKCLAFGDRIIKLNDYLLKEAANAKPAYKIVKGKRVYEKSVPVHMQSVAVLCNQLLRAGTSIGANNAEATNAISKTDYRAKSFIALKEARESLYWIDFPIETITLMTNSITAYMGTARNWLRYWLQDARR